MNKEELTDKKIIQLQAEAIKHLVEGNKEIRAKAKDSIQWAKENNYKPNKTLIDILEKANNLHDYITVKASKLDDLKKGRISENQETLS